MNSLKRLINYIITSRQELKKVIWPSKREITQHTFLVIGASLAVAAFLGLADYILTLILSLVI